MWQREQSEYDLTAGEVLADYLTLLDRVGEYVTRLGSG